LYQPSQLFSVSIVAGEAAPFEPITAERVPVAQPAQAASATSPITAPRI
jgi:hypothetical protein